MANLASSQQRDSVKVLSPPWLATGTAERFMYVLGLGADALLEKMNQGVNASLPGRCGPDALPIIGSDLVMPQGPGESNDSYTHRLQTALDTWQHAGSRRAVLEQVLGYVSALEATSAFQVPRGAIVGSSGGAGDHTNWDWFYNTDDIVGETNHYRKDAPSNWNWDGVYQSWRSWLILYFDGGGVTGSGTWGDGKKWGQNPTKSWGTNQTSTYWAAMRQLVRLWKSGGTYYPWFIVVLTGAGGTGTDTDLFSPWNAAASAYTPNGDYGRWGKTVNGVRVKARSSQARYLDGTGIYQQCTTPTGT